MASGVAGWVSSCIYNSFSLRNRILAPTLNAAVNEVLQVRNYAARKGTRERAKKKKVKVEVKKIEFIPHNLRGKKRIIIAKRIDDTDKPDSPDNVWMSKQYKWPVYDFAEAVDCHRETHHPTMYNCPDAKIFVNIELDMRAAKANRFMDGFTRVVLTPHPFEAEGPRPVLAFCKSHELQRIALEAGATVAGDTDLIKNVQSGDLNLQDFQFVVAHPNIVPELVSIRGLLKKKFPNQKHGTLGANIGDIVSRYCNGIEYSAKIEQTANDFGWIFAAFGKLDMETSQLEENFAAILEDVHSMKPKRDGPFITKCCLVSLPSKERLKVDFKKYIGEKEGSGTEEDDDDESSDEETDKREEKTAAARTV